MKTLSEIQRTLRAQESHLAEEFGVRVVGVFGSYVRGDARDGSDIDILVELEQPPRTSLIDLVEMEYFLGELLETKVHVAIKSSLRKRVGQRILDEVVPLQE